MSSPPLSLIGPAFETRGAQCGWGWGSEDSWEFSRVTLGKYGLKNILDGLGDGADKTPPKLGMVNISQLTFEHAVAKFGSFSEEESEILATQLTIRERNYAGRIFGCEAFEGASESWSGKMNLVTIPDRTTVVACAKVTNTFGVHAEKCSDPIQWDAAPPVVAAFYTVDPFTQNWKVYCCPCPTPHLTPTARPYTTPYPPTHLIVDPTT